ncbi:MAG: hypothetical protein Q9187_006963, partial [Circinaria calcarea]
MPQTVKPPTTSDDDSISLNSTVPSEPREEYPLERVLAEREKDGNKEYLVKWKDYPDERCTWEAEENFNNDNTIPEWERQKMLIKRGVEKAYDVEALELKVKRWIEETDRRKSRRRSKRLKAGLPVIPPAPDRTIEPEKRKVETSSDTEGDDYMPLDSPAQIGRKYGRLKKLDFSSDIDTDSDDAHIPLIHVSKPRDIKKASKSKSLVAKRGGESREHIKPMARTLDNDGDTPMAEDNSSTDDSLMADLRNRAVSESLPKSKRPRREVVSAVIEKPRSKALARQMNAAGSVRKAPSLTKESPQTLIENKRPMSREVPKPKTTLMGSKGRGPARFASKSAPSAKRPQVSGAAVLSNWASSLKPRKRTVGTPAKGNVKAKPSENLSTRRRYEKAGRNEPAPNIDQLTFVNLKDGRPIGNPSYKASMGNVQTPKASFQHLHEERVPTSLDSPPARMTIFTEASRDVAETSAGMSNWDESPGTMRTDETHESIKIMNNWPPQESPSEFPPTPARFHDHQREASRPLPSDSAELSRPWRPILQHMPQTMTLHQMIGDSGLRKLDGSSQQGIEDISDVFGSIVVGTNYEFVADVRFRGLPPLVKKILLTVKIPPKQVHMWFKHICTAADYRSYFHNDGAFYYGAGHVVTWSNSGPFVDAMGEILKIHNSGGLFFTPAFTMLIYPAGAEVWRWIDDRFPNHPTTKTTLRIVLRTPIPELCSSSPATVQTISPPLIMEDEIGTNALFRRVFGIEYARLVPQTNSRNKAKHPDNVFLMYPAEDQDEHDVLVKYFEYNNAIIYTLQTPGAWDYFAGQVDAGVLLIHDSITELHQIPGLTRIIRKPINIFNINLRPVPPNPFLTRLFPHGGALLLTDSLILNRPREVVRILAWFDTNILFNKPAGTWKLCLRPRFRSWILNIIQHKLLEEGKVYVEIYALIYKILPMELMDEDDDFETPKEEAPIAYASSIGGLDLNVGLGPKSSDTEGIARNDALLVDWFAGWTRMK